MFMLVSWFGLTLPLLNAADRSEERRVGKERLCLSLVARNDCRRPGRARARLSPLYQSRAHLRFFFVHQTAYGLGLGIPAGPLFRSILWMVAMMVFIIPSRTV